VVVPLGGCDGEEGDQGEGPSSSAVRHVCDVFGSELCGCRGCPAPRYWLRLRLVTPRGPPYPSRSPRAHPSGWTRTQGLSRTDSHAPPFLGCPPFGCGLASMLHATLAIILHVLVRACAPYGNSSKQESHPRT
jgi:hypothetical protein